MTIIKKSTNNKCWRGFRENGTLLHCWWECKLVQPLWKTLWRFHRKRNLGLLYDPAIPLLGIQPHKILIQKDIFYVHMFTIALFIIAKIQKQTKCPLTDKKDMIPIYNGILLSHKNPGNNAICSNKDATTDDHTD